MNRYLCHGSLCGFWRLALAAVFLLFTLGAARAITLVQEFYLPLPEWQVLQACKSITPSVTDTNFASITSILVTGDGTQIYYDQWEDGYEPNLALPTNATTQIWGDGIDANGIAPGFAHDPAGLAAGTVLILSNAVACSPRNPAQIFYDGRDRIAGSKALVVTRAGWPYPTGPVFGGSSVVQATIDWGTNYVSPIGQDLTENLFKYVGFFVMASQNGTIVTIDPDGPGPLLAQTNTLNQGESWFYPGGVRRGGTINANKPVEANLVCGDTVNTYAIDWFTLYPQADWSGTYYTPVPSTLRGGTLYLTPLYFYNPSATPITVLYTNLYATNNFVIPAAGGYKFSMPTNSGGVFASAGGEKYTVLCTVANAPADDTAYNWGFTPLPKGSLTTEADAGWSPGSSDYTVNGSPIWVTPTAATRIYVDYRGDRVGLLTDPNGGKYDTNFDLVNFQSQRIYVPGTNNDQTGLRVYTTDGTLLSVVWGQDTAVAGAGNPYLDLGNPVLPFPVPRLTKSAVIINDVAPAGLSVGDTLLYTVQVDNKGLLPLGNTVVIDAPPPSLNYISNSASLNGVMIPDSTSGTLFPLDAPGYTIPIILSGGTSVFQYQAQIVGAGSIVNAASIPGYNVNVTNTVPAIAPAPSFFVSKTIITPSSGFVGVGQTIQFNLQAVNNGNVPLTNVMVTDNYPSNLFSYVTASVTPNSAGNGRILWTNLGTLALGASTNLTITLLATNVAAPVTNTFIAAAPGNTTNTTSVTFTNLAAPVAAVTANKTLLSPAIGKAGIGQVVQFNLQAYNSGFATLTNLSLTDNFPFTNLAFVSASVTPSLITASNLVWTNLGSFAPGQLTNIVVNFTVTNFTLKLTNYVTAAAVGGATNIGFAALQISRSGLAVSKTVLSPTNQPVSLGSNVVFRLVIQNTGQLAITNLPFEDTFSASYFTYVTATIPPNTIAPGDLYWTNLAGSTGFATNAVLTNDVTMRVIGGASPAYNTALANFAMDVNLAAVAPASSVVGVNTAAGSISGKVYVDPDQSGTLTVGDSPLENVSLALYTDPNADGNPADGSFLQMISSDVNGYYELLNLNTGAFVVVETILPGFTGTAPANNRLGIIITSLTAATNQNFFQYQVPSVNYATVNGTVWNDVNGVGFFQAGDTGLTNVQVDLIQDLNTNGIVDIGESAVQSVFTATNGKYYFSAVAPGRYVIREIDPPGYTSTGDTQGTNDNQIALALGNGVTTNSNDFFDFYFGLGNTNSPPVAVPDFTNTLQNVPLIIQPLVNDNSPGGYALTITNVAATNGLASILGGTNISFTPSNYFVGTATIGYTITNANGKSTSLITITVSPAANLRFGKTGAAAVFAVSNLTYTISVTNFGPSSASSVTVTDALPSNVSFVSATGGGTTNGNNVIWNLGTLTSNQVSSVTLTVTAPASGSITNVATGGSPTGDPIPTNNVTPPVTTTVTPLADLAILKTAPATVNAASNFSYTITVTNLGPSSASGVIVTDTLPASVTFVSASGNGTNASGVVTWSIGTLSSNQVTNVTVTVTSPASGSVTNFASVGSPTGDPVPTNNVTPPVNTTVTPVADVSLVKTAPASVLPGTNFNYTITVSNAGPSSATSLSVTDNLPANVTFVSATAGYVTNGSQLVWTNLGTLLANTTTNLSITVIAPVRGGITNTASAGTPTLDPTPTNNVTPPITTTVLNVAPVAVNDFSSTPVNIPVTVFPLVNDFDTNGDAIFIVSVSATNGSASFTTNSVLFTPTANFLGTGTVGYTISDGFGGTNSAIIFISVTNRPPMATNDLASGTNGIAQIISPLGNDFDPDGDALTITSATSTNGIVTINGGNTTLTFTPTNGSTTINYTISDGRGGSASAVITVNVGSVADLMIAKVGPATVFANSNLTYTISVTNFGPSSASGVIVTDTLPVGVTFVSASGNGSNVSGVVTWNLGTLASAQATNLTVTVTSPTSGTLTNIASVGSPTPDPIPTNNITPPITTTVTPLAELQIGKVGPAFVSASSNLTYIISVTNFGPSTASSVIVTDTLPNNVSFVGTTGGGVNNSGVVTWNLGTLTSNQVSSVTVTVTAPASGSLTNSASVGSPTGDPVPTNNVTPPVTTTVTLVADLQIGKVGPATVSANSNLTYTISVTNFGPSSASSVTVTDALPSGVNFVSATSGGVNNSGVVTWSLGTLTSNQVSSVTVTVTPPASGSLTNFATVGSPTPDPTPTNNVTPPVTTTVTPVANLTIGKVGAATVLGNSNLTYTITVTNFGPSSASSVTVTDALPNSVTFVSATGSSVTNGNLVVWDLGTLASNQVSSVTVTVTPPTSGSLTNFASVGSPTPDPTPTNNVTPPVTTTVTPVADLAVGKSGAAASVLGANFTYTISVTNLGPSTAANFAVTDSLPNGIVFVSAVPSTTTNAINQVIWSNLGTLATNATTNLTLTVKAVTRGAVTNIATVGGPTLDPTPTNNFSPPVVTSITNRPPVAVDDSGSTARNVPVTIPVLANDSDPDGDPLTIVTADPTTGTFSIVGTNLVFTPTNAAPGTNVFTYTITDGFGGTNSAFITISVTNLPPVAVNDSASTARNVPVTIPVLANDSDPDGDALTIVSANPTNGTFSISGTNIVFTPTNAAPGTNLFSYTITDGFGGTNSALVIVTVTNRAPLATDDSATTARNVPVTIPVLANDSDPDGDALTIVSVTPTGGTAIISGTNIIFTPTNAAPGTNVFSYIIRDNFGGTNTALITVAVTNRAPVANNDSGSTPKNVAVTIPALANDSDPDGDVLTIISVSPTNGTANINGTNVVFTPATNFIGTATIGYVITDGFGGTNSALITITVSNRPPVANAQSTSTPFNTAKPLTLAGSDPDGDAFTFIIVSAPSGGTLTLLNTNTGAVTYTPTNNFTGVDSFTYRVNDGTTNSTPATVSITVGAPAIADLAVFKTGPTNGVAGSNLVYSITVTNLGTSIATNVLVSDQLPTGFTFVSATPTGVTVTSNVVTWSAFKLAPNAKTNFTVTAFSLEGGTFTNIAFATADALDPNPTNNNGTATNSQARTDITALADVQAFKDGGTNVAAGGTVNYVITATNAGPSTATNVVVQDKLPPGVMFQTASAGFAYSAVSNTVTWSALTLTNGQSVNFTLALTAPNSGQFTNIVLASSPTLDPNPTNNNGTLNKSRVATKVVPVADLVVLLYGSTNAVQGSNFVYSLILSNAGPSVASNAFASDELPPSFVFISATSSGVNSNGIIRWPKIAFLPVGGTSNYFITVNAPNIGTFTNIGSAIADTLDPNPTNNTGVAPASQALTTVSFAQFAWLQGTPVFNPQTGLYEEMVTVTNTGNGTVAGFQLYVTVLTSNVYLWNATGTNAGGAYVQSSSPLNPGSNVMLTLEFFDQFRVPFTNTLRVVPIIPAPAGNVGTNGSVAIDKFFTDTRTNGTRFVIEFVSVAGKTYTIIYSGDLTTWKVATPSVTATANVTQWYDDGPPKTESAPMSVTNRFYRVIKN